MYCEGSTQSPSVSRRVDFSVARHHEMPVVAGTLAFGKSRDFRRFSTETFISH